MTDRRHCWWRTPAGMFQGQVVRLSLAAAWGYDQQWEQIESKREGERERERSEQGEGSGTDTAS